MIHFRKIAINLDSPNRKNAKNSIQLIFLHLLTLQQASRNSNSGKSKLFSHIDSVRQTKALHSFSMENVKIFDKTKRDEF